MLLPAFTLGGGGPRAPPDQVEIRERRDRENGIAFYSVRFVRR
jgi:hypothetical protein